MPNYVMNRLQLDGENDAVRVVREFIRGDGGCQIDFNKIVPVPPHIYTGNLGEEHRKLFGTDTWYDWCPKYWGTKWNAICNNDAEKCTDDTIFFQTAWCGVIKLIYLLACRFPNIIFTYEFADEDFGNNCGKYVIKEGFAGVCVTPRNGSRDAFEIAQSLWHIETYYWDDVKSCICSRPDDFGDEG